jgi:rhamnose transport system permease protein
MIRRELSIAVTIAVVLIALGAIAPAFFATENLRDVFLANVPVLIIAVGATLVVVTGNIDISVGSSFAVCSVVAGVLAQAGAPVPVAALGGVVTGTAIGALNGALVAYAGIPAIVVTLAMLVVWRDALRWITQGAWVQGLPPAFQWFGMEQASFPLVVGTGVVALFAAAIFMSRHLAWGRFVYAVGSNREAARLAGLGTSQVVFAVFTAGGALTGLAAVVNAVRFNQIPSNTGLGLEMKVIAAVVVGGAAITGGRASLVGTLLGVVLLGIVGPALTFLGIDAYWERAIQGAIILAAVSADAVRGHVTAAATRAQPPLDALSAGPPAR